MEEVPPDGYRLTAVRLPHLGCQTTRQWRSRACRRNGQPAELARGDGRLPIVTEPVQLRRVLGGAGLEPPR